MVLRLNYVFTHLTNGRRIGHFSPCVNKRDCIIKRAPLQPFFMRPNSERTMSPIVDGRRRIFLIKKFAVPISNSQIPTLMSKACAPGYFSVCRTSFVQSLWKSMSYQMTRVEERNVTQSETPASQDRAKFGISCKAGGVTTLTTTADSLAIEAAVRISRSNAKELWPCVGIYSREEEDGSLGVQIVAFHPNWEEPMQRCNEAPTDWKSVVRRSRTHLVDRHLFNEKGGETNGSQDFFDSPSWMLGRLRGCTAIWNCRGNSGL